MSSNTAGDSPTVLLEAREMGVEEIRYKMFRAQLNN